MMDEVDGKPGPVALQSGHLDALNRVPTASLSLPLKFTVIPSQVERPGFRPSRAQIFANIRNTQEKHHENVPGK